MKTGLLLLAMCLSAHAALLPPMPVKRPAPLLSPKHAGAKAVPMAKAGAFTPASVPTYPVLVTVVNDFNFFHCDTNEIDCVFYDVTHVSGIAPAGKAVSIEFTDDFDAPDFGWAWIGRFGSAPYERVVEFEWYLPVDQRPVARFFRVVDTPMATFAPASAGGVRVSPNVKGARAWTRRK